MSHNNLIGKTIKKWKTLELMECFIPVVKQNLANHVNYLRSEVIDYHCRCMSLKLNSAHINIYFKLMILFPLELHLLWKHRVFASYFMISGNSQMSLFRHFTLWAPTCFPEAICLRYGPGYFISACFLATEVNICYGSNFPKRKYH